MEAPAELGGAGLVSRRRSLGHDVGEAEPGWDSRRAGGRSRPLTRAITTALPAPGCCFPGRPLGDSVQCLEGSTTPCSTGKSFSPLPRARCWQPCRRYGALQGRMRPAGARGQPRSPRLRLPPAHVLQRDVGGWWKAAELRGLLHGFPPSPRPLSLAGLLSLPCPLLAISTQASHFC